LYLSCCDLPAVSWQYKSNINPAAGAEDWRGSGASTGYEPKVTDWILKLGLCILVCFAIAVLAFCGDTSYGFFSLIPTHLRAAIVRVTLQVESSRLDTSLRSYRPLKWTVATFFFRLTILRDPVQVPPWDWYHCGEHIENYLGRLEFSRIYPFFRHC
jgi:hypothetical protein